MTAPGPGVVVMNIHNLHYQDARAFMAAAASALAHEYRAIVEAGFVLQVDCPDLFLARNVALPDSPYGSPRYRTPEQYLAHVDLSVAALTEGLAGLPAEQIRVHACNGNHPATPRVRRTRRRDPGPAAVSAGLHAVPGER
jgi:5-methyltetrahydropteroyltriglutamate--homocysteine methyltransferase